MLITTYQAIAISNSISKILESVLYQFIEMCDAVDDHQSGFREGHSTALRTHVIIASAEGCVLAVRGCRVSSTGRQTDVLSSTSTFALLVS